MPRRANESPVGRPLQRQRVSEDADGADMSESLGRSGRHVSKITRACDSCKV